MKCIVIDVYDGSLEPGDEVAIVLGDTSAGSPGIRAQSFQESAHEFRVLVDPTNACLVRRLPTSPVFPVVPGAPQRIVCVLPTNAVAGTDLEVFLRGEDEWGNPTPPPEGIGLSWQGTGRCDIEGTRMTFDSAAEGRICVRWNHRTFWSNPLVVLEQEAELRHYWGDLHAQSDATVGTGDEVEYFTFGRDQARLDFTSHQGNDFQMTDEDWSRLNDVVSRFHEDGRFVVFPGYEWSANSPAGGDRNVFYLEEGQPIIRSSHWQIPTVVEDHQTPAHPVTELFARIRESVHSDNVLLAAHVGGRYADIRRPGYFDQELGPLVEVASCWGVFEWLLWDAFDAGYVVGVMCNSDGHKGRPGAEGPGAGQFGIAGGLTCVLAEKLTRDSVFAALKNRRCYGTTGPRIALWFTADGHPMGSCIDAAAGVTLKARCVGTAPVEALRLYKGREPVAEARPADFEAAGRSRRVRVSWGGSRIRGRGRRVVWDGSIRLAGGGIREATTVAFDSPADGILRHDAEQVDFRSRTTGDIDGIDLWLDEPGRGKLEIETAVGSVSVRLEQLGDEIVREEFGGLGMHIEARRYPESLTTLEATLEWDAPKPDGVEPYFVKAVQADGHAAWSSPIYLRSAHDGREQG
jgi:hypothetical protein